MASKTSRSIRTGLRRSAQTPRVRNAEAKKLADLRGKEKGASYSKRAFDKAVDVAGGSLTKAMEAIARSEKAKQKGKRK